MSRNPYAISIGPCPKCGRLSRYYEPVDESGEEWYEDVFTTDLPYYQCSIDGYVEVRNW